MYQALYRAYRPEVFEEVLGQEHIVRILKNQIANDSTSHAYLFCGTRGTGKTTTARLLAKGLNCLDEGDKPCGKCANCLAIKEGKFIDVIEIDAASHNGVDNIRELNESVNYPPAMGRKKIYIIDEVHMLSTGAFNALLKNLEEPPSYVTYILATTEIQKVPATILSRCMRLDFKRVPERTLIEGMAGICNKIGINVTDDALRIIAANADGSVRDGLSILDQCISGGDKEVNDKIVLDLLGVVGDGDFLELTYLVLKKSTSEALQFLDERLQSGKDVKLFLKDWINHYRNLLMAKYVKDPSSILSMSTENIERLRRQADHMDLEYINRGILELSKTYNESKWSTQPRILLELAIIKLCLDAGEIKKFSEFDIDEDIERARKAPARSRETKPEKRTESYEEQAIESEPERDIEEFLCEEKARDEAITTPEPVTYSPAVKGEKFDCEEIWNLIFEEGEAKNGSFLIVRNGGTLTSINDDSFDIVVGSEIHKNIIEKNRQIIEELMEKYTGKHRVMKIARKSLKDNKGQDVEAVSSEASEFLGVDVEIR